MPEKKVLSARFQASFLMDNILSEKRLLADLNLNLIMQNLSAADRARSQRLLLNTCLLYTSPSPRDGLLSRMPSSA